MKRKSDGRARGNLGKAGVGAALFHLFSPAHLTPFFELASTLKIFFEMADTNFFRASILEYHWENLTYMQAIA